MAYCRWSSDLRSADSGLTEFCEYYIYWIAQETSPIGKDNEYLQINYNWDKGVYIDYKTAGELIRKNSKSEFAKIIPGYGEVSKLQQKNVVDCIELWLEDVEKEYSQ